MLYAMSHGMDESYPYMEERGFSMRRVRFEKGGEDETIERYRGIGGVAVMGEPFTARVLDALKDDLKILVRHGIGYDNLDIGHAAKLGICCCNTPGTMSTGVAETTLAMMLELSRGYHWRDAEMRQGKWNRAQPTHQIEGTTVGIIGFGNIGQRVAQYLTGFNCTLLAYDVFFTEEAAARYGVRKATLEEIAAQCDFVSVHVPLLPETEKMIDAAFLAKMKQSAYLINTSRGGTVDEAALIDALRSNVIAGAGLDVFEQEPTPAGNPLRSLPNVFLTPHISTNTFECMRAGFDGIVKCFREYEAGKVPEFCLNPEYANHLR